MNENQLLSLLQKKKSFFESILELTELESTLPVKELINSLEQKTILLSCIEEVDEELKHYKAALGNLTQEMQDEMDKTKEIVECIMRLNAENVKQRKLQFKHPG
jgi:hypothetical protein